MNNITFHEYYVLVSGPHTIRTLRWVLSNDKEMSKMARENTRQRIKDTVKELRVLRKKFPRNIYVLGRFDQTGE